MSANLLLHAPSQRIFHRVSTASIARSHSRSWRFPFPDPHLHRERSSPARRKETAKNAKTRQERQEFGRESDGLYKAYPPLGSFNFGRRLTSPPSEMVPDRPAGPYERLIVVPRTIAARFALGPERLHRTVPYAFFAVCFS